MTKRSSEASSSWDMGSRPPARQERNFARGSKAEASYQMILGKILDRTYGPGYRLVLSQLALETGTSVVPVREALRRLEAEGYVDFRRNIGAIVCGISPADFAERLQALATLESAAIALAASLAGPADLAAARRANEAVARSIANLDPEDFSRSNQEFHRALYATCRNTYLTGLLEREWTQSVRLMDPARGLVLEQPRQAVAEHAHLIELVERGADIAAIEESTRNHRLHGADRLLRRLDGS
jgi:DNA-binding GntR family transcriptional regulator